MLAARYGRRHIWEVLAIFPEALRGVRFTGAGQSEADREPPLGCDGQCRANRGERLGDRGVHTAVDQPVGLL